MAESAEGGAVCAVLVTAPDEQTGDHLAGALVEEGLAACVTLLLGGRSIFCWEGKIERAREVLLVIKTVEAAIERLRARVVDLHPYDVPEFLVFPAATGHEPYLEWVRSVAGKRDG